MIPNKFLHKYLCVLGCASGGKEKDDFNETHKFVMVIEWRKLFGNYGCDKWYGYNDS